MIYDICKKYKTTVITEASREAEENQKTSEEISTAFISSQPKLFFSFFVILPGISHKHHEIL